MTRPSDAELDAAAACLRDGGLVAFPTETVYGLGADASNPDAVRRIFEAKGRPADHPVIVHIASADRLAQWADPVPPAAVRLADAFWPGPLTLVLPRAAGVPDAVTGGMDTVGLRVPGHPVAQALLRRAGRGIAAPSANRYGRVSPTTAAHVRAEMGDRVDHVLDGGACEVGIESTILDLSGAHPVLLRPGRITVEAIEAVLGDLVREPEATSTPAPGRKPSHYAPRARVVVVEAADAEARVAELAGQGARVGLLAPRGAAHAAAAVVLDLPVDAAAQAQCLYQRLRDADAAGVEVLVAVLPPARGVGLALRDRLLRAAGLGDGRPDARQ